ncbi:hypothetical protein F4777DRAFT_494334 [Nemania sp. FL0916]|nr:hypothetical protein F4777DRAFT_494334 [Nemania sp. FL0916]
MALRSRFGTAAVRPVPPDTRTSAPPKFVTMNMPLPLPTATGAIIAVSDTNLAAVFGRVSQLFTTFLSVLHIARQYERLFSTALLSLLLQTSFLASGLLPMVQYAAVRAFQATGALVYHSTLLSRHVMRLLWNNTHAKRLRKKIEFEFFTLILGAGGNNLFLVIFWPGWGVLALGAMMLSSWYAG